MLAGHADAALLDSYDAERRPVANANLAWSLENGKRFPAIRQALATGDTARAGELLDAQGGHVSALGQDLGFAYASGAILPDHSPAPDFAPEHYTPSARPGHRAPAVALPDGRSTLDLFDDSFTLLTGRDGQPWQDAAQEVGSGAWLRTLAVDQGPLAEAAADLHTAYGISTGGAVLVRPDGHVAWRAAALPDDPAGALRTALTALHLTAAHPAATGGRP
ncbi:aromatic-ring hydroxylase C-terminal domain-containing protein [Streptacidiphilus sp. PAMC 29251]